MQTNEKFTLEVPIDASGIEDLKSGHQVKVVVQDRHGATYSQTVVLDQKGAAKANFDFKANPGSLKVIVGPANASDEELPYLSHAISTEVSSAFWKERNSYALHPILISHFYWYWWLRWCREYTISGRVICADGSPVPGAQVCAYDIDWWWWWSSKQQVGCATTDANGSFTFKFKWCCGWWPWWWWEQRIWELDVALANRILPVLNLNPRLKKLSKPSPVPTLDIFENGISDRHGIEDNTLINRDGLKRNLALQENKYRSKAIDFSALPKLRDKLIQYLPPVGELERLRIWPWAPWYPWQDCAPDIVFKVTQDCKEKGVVILNENFYQTRWNISTTLDVTLQANENACCVDGGNQDPDHNCVNFTSVCGNDVSTTLEHVGGNLGADPSIPLGYFEGDRPFAGVIPIYGNIGTLANMDYYEFQYANSPAGPWTDVPATAYAAVDRPYFGEPGANGEPGFFHSQSALTTVSGKTVIETPRFFESKPGWTANPHLWINRNFLFNWYTKASTFPDGVYYLRLKGYKLIGGVLVPSTGGVAADQEGILPVCLAPEGEENTPNFIVLTLDNRFLDDGVNEIASTPGNPCGAGTIHSCTREPDTDIINVTIIRSGSPIPINACGSVVLQQSDNLQVDFKAYDPDGHLDWYELKVTFGENEVIYLPTTNIVPLSGTGDPAALQVGPTYAQSHAFPQTGTRPIWAGGVMRLTASALDVFPKTCCYQLELVARKRTLVSCSAVHENRSEYSFTIIV